MRQLTLGAAKRAVRAALLTLPAGTYSYDELVSLIEPTVGRNTAAAIQWLVATASIGSYTLRGRQWLEVSPDWMRTVAACGDTEWLGPPLNPRPLAPRPRRTAPEPIGPRTVPGFEEVMADTVDVARTMSAALLTLDQGAYEWEALADTLADCCILQCPPDRGGREDAVQFLRWAADNDWVQLESMMLELAGTGLRDVVVVFVNPAELEARGVDSAWFTGVPLEIPADRFRAAPRWNGAPVPPPLWDPMPPLPPPATGA